MNLLYNNNKSLLFNFADRDGWQNRLYAAILPTVTVGKIGSMSQFCRPVKSATLPQLLPQFCRNLTS
jgi:hypothetical protein